MTHHSRHALPPQVTVWNPRPERRGDLRARMEAPVAPDGVRRCVSCGYDGNGGTFSMYGQCKHCHHVGAAQCPIPWDTFAQVFA